MPMKIKTAVEVAADAPNMWDDQYDHWDDDRLFANGRSKREVASLLYSKAPTPEHVASVLNMERAFPCCGICNEYFYATIIVAKDYSGDAVNICAGCLGKAHTIISQVKNDAAPKIRGGNE